MRVSHFSTLIYSIALLLIPVYGFETEAESTRDEVEQSEPFIELISRRHLRETNIDLRIYNRLSLVTNPGPAVTHFRTRPVIGHRLKPHLLAPLTC